MSFTRGTIIRELTANVPNCRMITGVKVPDVTLDDVVSNRKACEKNLCGHYNTSWTCPPNCGSDEFCMKRFKQYSNADVIAVTYDNVDFSDKESVEKKLSDFQKLSRKIMIGCREHGFDVMTFSEGPCNYCEICAFLDGKKCRNPDMQVPSVSGNGIDMERYLSSIGESFKFEKNRMTLYGVFLFR